MDDPILRELLLEAGYAGDDDDDDDGSPLADVDGYLVSVKYDCPFCGSTCVDYVGDLTLEGHVFQHDCACRMCDEAWTESYDLTGYLSYAGV